MKKIFLGGTCSRTTWRKKLIPMLKIDYFNPMTKGWNEEARQLEVKEREKCDYVLYVITPTIRGYYSIAEAVDDSNKRPEKTIFCLLESEGESFTTNQKRTLNAVANLVRGNGAFVCHSLEEIANHVNP